MDHFEKMKSSVTFDQIIQSLKILNIENQNESGIL
jgi:hypothetical protein